jgi:hypothetical protein
MKISRPKQYPPSARFVVFDDDRCIKDSCGVWRQVCPLLKHPDNPLLLPDQAWEREVYTYGSLLWDKGKFRLWYQILNRGISLVRLTTAIGYAESKDGLCWKKPKVALKVDGVGKTNIIRTSSGRTDLCSPSVIKVNDPKWPYRLFFFDAIEDANVANKLGTPNQRVNGWGPVSGEGIFIGKSKDGISWSINSTPLQFGPTDALAATTLANGDILLVFKTSVESDRHFRIIAASISKDNGASWGKPKIILKPDQNDPPGTEFYGLTPFIRHGKLYGFLQVYHNAPDDKRLDVQLVTPEDQQAPSGRWIRLLSRNSILSCGDRGEWDAARIYPGSPFVASNGQILMTYGGANTRHDDRRYIRRSIGVAYLLPPGFSELKTDQRGGWVTLEMENLADAKTIEILALTKSLHLITASIRGQALTSKYIKKSSEFTGYSIKNFDLPRTNIRSDQAITIHMAGLCGIRSIKIN